MSITWDRVIGASGDRVIGTSGHRVIGHKGEAGLRAEPAAAGAWRSPAGNSTRAVWSEATELMARTAVDRRSLLTGGAMGKFRLSGVGVRDRPGLCRSQDNRTDIAVVAAISGPGRERLRPHLFVGQPVCTDDGGRRKLTSELVDLINARKFQVHDGHVCPMLRDGMAQIFNTADKVYSPKMVVQGLSERLTRFAVALGDNYTERLHTTHPCLLEAFPPGSQVTAGRPAGGKDFYFFAVVGTRSVPDSYGSA